MSIPLYMDVHVPLAITAGLRLRSVDVLTSQEDGTATLLDPALLTRATTLGRALFTQDKGLLGEATRRQQVGEFFAGLVFAAQLKVTIGQCVNDLEIIAKVGDPSEFANRIEYLPL